MAHVERAVEASKNTIRCIENMRKLNSMTQILENLKTNYLNHAKHTGKILPDGWDTVGLQQPPSPKGATGAARGLNIPKDPNYNPELIDHLDPKVMSLKKLEDYQEKFDKEIGELAELQAKRSAKEYTAAKMQRKNNLEEKFVEFDMEREVSLANREKTGGSKRERNRKSLKILMKPVVRRFLLHKPN